jgi:HK97 family phage major capsid protein
MTRAEKILKMKEERANLSIQIRGILDEHESKEMEAGKKDEFRKLEDQFGNLNEKITTEERQLERERMLGEEKPAKVDEKRENPESEAEKRNAEIRAAYQKYLKEGSSSALGEYRALAQDNPTQAGYLVAPQKFMAEIIEDKNNLTFMRQVSRVLPALEKAQSLGFPKRTARMSTFAWGTEIQSPTADTSLAFGKREFIPRPATGGILVSKTLIRNSAIDPEAYIRSEMAYNASTNEESAFMTGNGVNKPLGVFTASADGISTSRDVSTGNTATEIKFDGLYETKYSIKEQYWNGLNWVFHRDGVKQIAKLKDADGQYIWQPSVAVGTPDTLLSFPVRMTEYAPNTFTSALYVGILGNFKEGYWICDSLNLEIQALVELYALSNQIYFIGRHEVDGMPVMEDCFARVKLA